MISFLGSFGNSYFPSTFIFVTESFKKIFGGVSDLSIYFQSLKIKYRISLLIILFMTLERPSFSSNVIEEIRPGRGNLLRPLIIVA